MTAFFIIFFYLLILASAFFSSAETAVLTMSRIKLSHMAKKQNKKAKILLGLLQRPEDFFSTILIGNNLVNVAAATLATYLFTKLFKGNQTLILAAETLATAVTLLLLGEIIPKSYAYHHAETLAPFYAYPLLFFRKLFSPFIRITSLVSSILVRGGTRSSRKEFSLEEIKHFLSHETQLFQYNPETLRMVNEIIEISRKDLRSIMTPRPAIVALEENAGIEALKTILLEKKLSKIPIYRKRLDHITGVIHPYSLLPALLEKEILKLRLKEIAAPPILVSAYSSLHYVLEEFKRHRLNLAVVLDEYGATVGIITLSDILRETVSDLKWRESASIQKVQKNVFRINGSMPVEEVNTHLEWDLPLKKFYTTLSGLFVYHYGKLPAEKSRIQVGRYLMIVQRLGKRRIEEVTVIVHENHPRQP